MDYKDVHYESCGDGWTAYGYYDQDAYEIDIPDEINGKPVVQIESGAFRGMKNLEAVWIGKNVTLVESEAFSDCPSLKSVEIMSPEVEFDSYVFSSCVSLKRFYAAGIVSLSSGVFYRCKKLEEFTGIIDMAYRHAFAYCESLKDGLQFAEEVYYFTSDAFRGNCGIKNLYFAGSIDKLGEPTLDSFNSLILHCNENSNVCDLAYEGYNIVVQGVSA